MRSRQKILDATLALIEREGFGAVNIARVAVSAGVSRQTVYSIFGSREDLVSQVIVVLATELMTGMQAHLLSAKTPTDFVVELIVVGRAALRDHPVLGGLLRPDEGNPVFDDEMMDRAAPVALLLLQPLFEQYPELGDRRDDISEMAIRLGLSVILFDSRSIHTDDDLRAFLNRWLAPSLEVSDPGG